jgi:type IV secretory pathway VirB4 component
MPTSNEEARRIQEIIDEYLTVDQAREITTRLYEEVGQDTDNDSLKVSLQMLRSLYQ